MIDFGETAADYARFRRGYDTEFFDRLASLNVGLAGQKIVDLGTGTGLFARALTARGCHVIGVDCSEAMLAYAKKLDSSPEHGRVEYRLGTAEATGLPSSSFDCVTASTCWHWFDRPAAAREAYRILLPSSKLVIAALDWLRLPGNVIEATLDLVAKYQSAPHKGPYTFIYPDWTSDLIAAGFKWWEVFAYTTTLNYSHEAWCGRVRASADSANLGGEKLTHLTDELRQMLLRRFPADPMQVDHKVFCLVAEG